MYQTLLMRKTIYTACISINSAVSSDVFGCTDSIISHLSNIHAENVKKCMLKSRVFKQYILPLMKLGHHTSETGAKKWSDRNQTLKNTWTILCSEGKLCLKKLCFYTECIFFVCIEQFHVQLVKWSILYSYKYTWLDLSFPLRGINKKQHHSVFNYTFLTHLIQLQEVNVKSCYNHAAYILIFRLCVMHNAFHIVSNSRQNTSNSEGDITQLQYREHHATCTHINLCREE